MVKPGRARDGPVVYLTFLSFECELVAADDYNYDNKAIADIILEEMENVKFLGISVSHFFRILYLYYVLVCLLNMTHLHMKEGH